MGIPVGGRLCHFAKEWHAVTEDVWLRATVRDGYRVEFTGTCPVSFVPVWTPVPSSHDAMIALEKGLSDLLLKRAVVAIDPLREPPGFFSTMFLVRKKSGGWRPILNLKGLNKFILPEKFRMETLASVKAALGESRLHRLALTRERGDPSDEPGPWAVSLDLKDAYFHVSILPSHAKYFRFAYRGAVYEYRVLPFGLSTAPRTFTRLVRALATFLRKMGVEIYAYLDD